jgi:arginine exporter protein ArgO
VWIIKTSGFVVLAFFSLIGPAFRWFVNNTEAQRWLWDNWPFLVAILLALKTAAMLWVAARLHRTRLVTDERLLLTTILWFGAVALLYFALVWWIDTPLIPSYRLLMIATLAIPFARLAAAPLALASNRHR